MLDFAVFSPYMHTNRPKITAFIAIVIYAILPNLAKKPYISVPDINPAPKTLPIMAKTANSKPIKFIVYYTPLLRKIWQQKNTTTSVVLLLY